MKTKMFMLFISMTLVLSGCGTGKQISDENKDALNTNEPRYEMIQGRKYLALSFCDSVELSGEENCGWLIDLNGDNQKERLYVANDNLYLNDECIVNGFSNNVGNSTFWLIDINTKDKLVGILIRKNFYELYHYTEEGELEIQYDICGYYDWNETDEKALDVRNPIRIDDETIAFWDWHFLFDTYSMIAHYQLDENNNLVLIPQVYEIDNPHPIAYLNTTVPLKLYCERDLNGEYFECEGPAVYMLTKSDGMEWVYLESHYGVSGWIYVEEVPHGMRINKSEEISGKDFIGYSNVP